jgi:hypothetical protein
MKKILFSLIFICIFILSSIADEKIPLKTFLQARNINQDINKPYVTSEEEVITVDKEVFELWTKKHKMELRCVDESCKTYKIIEIKKNLPTLINTFTGND